MELSLFMRHVSCLYSISALGFLSNPILDFFETDLRDITMFLSNGLLQSMGQLSCDSSLSQFFPLFFLEGHLF